MAVRVWHDGILVEPASSGVFPFHGGIYVAEIAAAGTNVDATTAALTLATHAATVNAATNISATTAALTLATYAATVSLSGDVNVNASTAALNLATHAATVSLVSNDVEVSAGVATLTLSTKKATIDAPSKGGGFGISESRQKELEARQRAQWERQAKKVKMIREDDEIVAAMVVKILEGE